MQERNLKFSGSVKGNRYLELKEKRQDLAEYYIKQGKMADPELKYSLGSAPALVGECLDMCPLFERHEREFQTGGLDKVEKIPGTENVDHEKAVKRYRRSAAGDPPPLPCDVRPPNVLMKTLDYLLQEILANNGLLDSYSFVRDRARAIRNDLTLQNYRGKEAVDICEKIARYHILTSHELCDAEGISLQQEHEQMRKTLQSLMEFYKEMNEKNIQMPNEAEFQAYYILTHAYSNETASKAETLSKNVFSDPQVQFALEIQSMMARTNEEYIQGRASENGSLNLFSAIFRELEKSSVSYLMACCIHLNFVDIRRGALKAMQRAFYCFLDDTSSIWPLEDLVVLLGYDSEEDVLETLDYYDIPYQHGAALIGKQINGSADQKLNKGNFKEGQRVSLAPRKSSRIVSKKRIGISDVDIIQGRFKTLPVRPNEHFINRNQINLPLSFQPNSSPDNATNKYQAPQSVKKQIPSEDINDYTNAFLHNYLTEILYQDPYFPNMLQNRLNAINSICWEIVNSIADQVVQDIVSERLRITKTVSFYLRALETISVEIIDEVVESELSIIGIDCISHFDALREHEKMYQLLGWDRWRYCLKRNKSRIFFKQKNAEELLLNLKGFSAVTPKKTKRILNQNTVANTQLIFKEDGDQQILTPLDLVTLLANSKSGLTTFKLSVCVPSTPKIAQNFEQFLNFWLRTKLSKKLHCGFGYLARTVNDKTLHVVTQNVQDSEIKEQLLPNHLSICSGISSAVFTLDPYIENSTNTLYWKSQSDRLFAFICTLPLQAKIPLLLVYWSNNSSSELSEEKIMSHLGLAFILKDGPISSSQCIRLVANPAFFDSHSLSIQLNYKLVELMRKCENIEARLHFNIQKEIIESKVFNLFDDLLKRSQEKLYDMYHGNSKFSNNSADIRPNEFQMALSKSQSRLFLHFISLFNTTINSIEHIVTEFDLQCVAYPAKEFSDLNLCNGIRLDWNSDTLFSEIRTSFQSFQLYAPYELYKSNQGNLNIFYTHYANIPQFELEDQDFIRIETERILDIYASSEWLSKMVNIYTKICLEKLFTKLDKLHPPFFAKTFSDHIHHHMYIIQKETYLLLEEIIEKLSYIQNLNYTTEFRKTRKRNKSAESSPKADDARKKMKDLVALAQKEIENVQHKLAQF